MMTVRSARKRLGGRALITIGVTFLLGIAWTVSSGKVVTSLLVVRDSSQYLPGDDVKPQGTLQLHDGAKGGVIELGYYRYGSGLYSSDLFEFYTSGVSVRNQQGSGRPFLAVRDDQDTMDIRLLHDGMDGVIATTGTNGTFMEGGNIRVQTVPFAKFPEIE